MTTLPVYLICTSSLLSVPPSLSLTDYCQLHPCQSRNLQCSGHIKKKQTSPEMFIYYATALVIATAMMVVAFLLMTSGNFEEFKSCWRERAPRITELPITAPTGQILNSLEDLDIQLELWENQLEEKQKELDSTKKKRDTAEERLAKLCDITNQTKKYCIKLIIEIAKSEAKIGNFHNELRRQLNDLREIQIRSKEEVNENVKYYTGMLNNIERSVVTDGYEIIKNSSINSGLI
ncbi:uncharacterized protein [Euwallacea fornicatus]|uniref:uncharacterized protein n=1 Tax=Euwallacea fornicatus TaxID=995702 RepID=UPI00338DF998